MIFMWWLCALCAMEGVIIAHCIVFIDFMNNLHQIVRVEMSAVHRRKLCLCLLALKYALIVCVCVGSCCFFCSISSFCFFNRMVSKNRLFPIVDHWFEQWPVISMIKCYVLGQTFFRIRCVLIYGLTFGIGRTDKFSCPTLIGLLQNASMWTMEMCLVRRTETESLSRLSR